MTSLRGRALRFCLELDEMALIGETLVVDNDGVHPRPSAAGLSPLVPDYRSPSGQPDGEEPGAVLEGPVRTETADPDRMLFRREARLRISWIARSMGTAPQRSSLGITTHMIRVNEKAGERGAEDRNRRCRRRGGVETSRPKYSANPPITSITRWPPDRQRLFDSFILRLSASQPSPGETVRRPASAPPP